MSASRLVRNRVKGRTKEVAYKVPITRLQQANDLYAELDAELDAIIRKIYVIWAERKGFPEPPPLG